MKFLNAGVMLVLVLSGCSQPTESETEALEPQVQETAEAQVSNVASDAKVAVVQKQEKPKIAKKKLDLSIPLDTTESLADEPGNKEQALMPDMFVKKEATTKVGGGVIRDAENQNYMDSIEGAQIDIEIKH